MDDLRSLLGKYRVVMTLKNKTLPKKKYYVRVAEDLPAVTQNNRNFHGPMKGKQAYVVYLLEYCHLETY